MRDLIQRLRTGPRGVPLIGEARKPFRLWMTGSVAVVMVAMLPLRDVSEAEREGAARVLRNSRYSVAETVARIEAAARDRGLSVLAMTGGERRMLVLASSVGGTPVVMNDADSPIEVPLGLMVRVGRGGGCDVLIASALQVTTPHLWRELPAAVVEDVRALPELIDRALA